MPDVQVTVRGLLMLGLVVSLAGCGDDGPVSAERPVPSSTGAPGPDEYLVGCGEYGYPPSALAGLTGVEADDAARAALRDTIAEFSSGGPIPADGWRLLYDDGSIVIFGHGDPAVSSDGISTFQEIRFKREGEQVRLLNSSDGCVPRVVLDGESLAEFILPDGVTVSPDASAIDVLVYERACSGAGPTATDATPIGDRLYEPRVVYKETSVEVLFTAEPLPPGSDCYGNPSANVKLLLDEPLGERRLVDASTFPPADVATRPSLDA